MLQIPSRFGLSVCLTLALGAAGLAPQAHADERSWSALSTLRTTLEARSPVAVDFTQTLILAGSEPEDGESESGRLAINLPACLRWDYLGDFEQSYLLCDAEGYYWNPGETVGTLFSLDGQEEVPGLDFFLQDTAVLKQRYQATSEASDGEITIDLVPNSPTDDVVALRLVIDQSTGLLRSMSYDDVDGTTSLFVLRDYRAHKEPTSFTPPAGITWDSQ